MRIGERHGATTYFSFGSHMRLQDWTTLDIAGQLWTGPDKTGRGWTFMDTGGQFWTFGGDVVVRGIKVDGVWLRVTTRGVGYVCTT